MPSRRFDTLRPALDLLVGRFRWPNRVDSLYRRCRKMFQGVSIDCAARRVGEGRRWASQFRDRFANACTSGLPECTGSYPEAGRACHRSRRLGPRDRLRPLGGGVVVARSRYRRSALIGLIALTAGIVGSLTRSDASGAGTLRNLRQRPQRSVDRSLVRKQVGDLRRNHDDVRTRPESLDVFSADQSSEIRPSVFGTQFVGGNSLNLPHRASSLPASQGER
jgi:hypothetical protein